ncbi:MAG: hypothetical protein R3B09_17235 [Nannocystaceae bacterium]
MASRVALPRPLLAAALLMPLSLGTACSGDDGESRGDGSASASAGTTTAGTTTAGTGTATDTDASASVATTSSGTDTASTTASTTADTTTTAGTGESTTTGVSGTDPTDTSGDPTGDPTTDTTDTTGDTDTTTGEPEPIPVHDIPGLLSITFWERSGGDGPTDYTFTILGPELTTILPDPLTDQSHDIKGVSTEFYDVYYSDIDGNFDVDGSYLTIAGAFGHPLPAGGGLNLAEIALNYDDNKVEFGSYVASFVALGDNAVPDSAPKSIDGDLQTHTTMGNNLLEPDKRLRVTLGFKSSLMPQ